MRDDTMRSSHDPMSVSLTACIWRSQEWLVPMRTLLLEAEHTLVGWPSWMAQLCSYWGEFHKQKNQCIEVRHESLGGGENRF